MNRQVFNHLTTDERTEHRTRYLTSNKALKGGNPLIHIQLHNTHTCRIRRRTKTVLLTVLLHPFCRASWLGSWVQPYAFLPADRWYLLGLRGC